MLRRWRRLLPAERRLRLRSLFWLVTMRVALRVLPLTRLRQWTTRPRHKTVPLQTSAAQVGGVVSAMSRFVPGATCLVQALATQELLRAADCVSQLQIGVARNPKGEFAAHAWVVCDEEIIIGATPETPYQPLWGWNEPPPSP